jgi:hypothetical protein
MNALDPIPKPAGQSFLRRFPAHCSARAVDGWRCSPVFGFGIAPWVGRALTYITVGSQPDLLGYLCWLIFLSLGIFVLWALLSWTLAVAPLVLFLEGEDRLGATIRALLRSFSLGKTLSGKLMEVSLVLAIVKIMLIVLDMVFSAAPLPFASEFGPDALHVVYVVVFVGFLVGNDFFHVVRLRSFRELWRHYCSEDKSAKFASDKKISQYSNLQDQFALQILDINRWFVSDESSLWDFTTDDTLEPYYAKIRQVYGVDVSDIDEALLWKIFQRIAERT